jgi:hypothetical protein
MRRRAFLFAALLAATPGLPAQVEEMEMPNPKHEEHDALKALAGTWDCVMKMEAMPGVPGMEEPSESKGIEHAELICNGLFLKSTMSSTWNGQPFQGVWIAGYDPFKKQYGSVWVSSDEQECSACVMTGSYAEDSETWTWSGTTPSGEMRSEFVVHGPNRTVETCYLKTPDGEETKCMEITRTRTRSGAIPVEAAAKTKVKLLPQQQALLDDAGDWEATMKTSFGGQESEEKGTESVTAICQGRWLWSDFRGSFMGAPFEGHALIGYDPTEEKCVSFWFDSTSPVPSKTSGAMPEGKKAFAMEGSCVDPMGNPMTIKQRVSRKDDDTRLVQMVFTSAEGDSTMDITYRRKAKK